MPVVNRDFRPSFPQLRTFATVADHGHFGAAAKHLGISQPSLSQALTALENGLGVQLIERSTRKVIVTPVGRALLPYARATVEAAETFMNEAKNVTGDPSGPICIGMIPTIAPYLISPFLENMQDFLGHLEPQIVEEKTPTLQQQLRHGHVDLTILSTGQPDHGLGVQKLYDEDFVLVVPRGHRYAGRRDLTFQKLVKLDLLLLDDGHCLRDQVLDLCRTVEMTQDPRFANTRATSLTTLTQLVAAGHGVTLVPMTAVLSELQHPGIEIASFSSSEKHVGRSVCLSYRLSSNREECFHDIGRVLTYTYQMVERQARQALGLRAPKAPLPPRAQLTSIPQEDAEER